MKKNQEMVMCVLCVGEAIIRRFGLISKGMPFLYCLKAIVNFFRAAKYIQKDKIAEKHR